MEASEKNSENCCQKSNAKCERKEIESHLTNANKLKTDTKGI